MELNALLARQDALPSIPKVLVLLHAELRNADPDLRKICQLVSNDPALAASMMRCANGRMPSTSRRLGGGFRGAGRSEPGTDQGFGGYRIGRHHV